MCLHEWGIMKLRFYGSVIRNVLFSRDVRMISLRRMNNDHSHSQQYSRYGRVSMSDENKDKSKEISLNKIPLALCPRCVWWGSEYLCSTFNHFLSHSCVCHSAIFSLPCHQSCPGVWENCHLPTREDPDWRCPRSWSVLHHSVCWHLWGHWHESAELLCSSSRGKTVPDWIQCWMSMSYFRS